MECKGCKKTCTLIKAHIIPRSFYMDLRDSENHLNVLSSESHIRSRRSFIGDYDPDILCQDCDSYLGRFDQYGKNVLLDETFQLQPISKKGMVAGWEIEGCNPVRLEKFFLSIIWRASISSRSFFERVHLGTYENVMKQYLWGDEISHDSFGCVVSKFHPSKTVSSIEKTIFDPNRFKHRGINFYRLYLGGYMIWVRIDKRKSIGTLGKLELTDGSPCIVTGRSFDTSKEYNVIKSGV